MAKIGDFQIQILILKVLRRKELRLQVYGKQQKRDSVNHNFYFIVIVIIIIIIIIIIIVIIVIILPSITIIRVYYNVHNCLFLEYIGDENVWTSSSILFPIFTILLLTFFLISISSMQNHTEEKEWIKVWQW